MGELLRVTYNGLFSGDKGWGLRLASSGMPCHNQLGDFPMSFRYGCEERNKKRWTSKPLSLWGCYHSIWLIIIVPIAILNLRSIQYTGLPHYHTKPHITSHQYPRHIPWISHDIPINIQRISHSSIDIKNGYPIHIPNCKTAYFSTDLKRDPKGQELCPETQDQLNRERWVCFFFEDQYIIIHVYIYIYIILKPSKMLLTN